ncbi:MAG: response regulator transcription factor [Bacteroidales bacterium]
MEKILLIEDDETLNFLISDVLSDKGYDVYSATDGQKGIDLFYTSKPCLVVLDVMLPKIDGFDLARQIRSKDKNTPIIFLTARQLKEDKLKGLRIGGDDYLTKPFDIEELLLKIEIFLKRSKITKGISEEAYVKGVKLDTNNRTLITNNTVHNLTFKETSLISYLMKNPNRILSREEILEEVWETSNDILSRSLDVFISKTRRYFKNAPNVRIENVHGTGYRFFIDTDYTSD